MGEEQSSEPVKVFAKVITDIAGYVAALIAYVVAIRGLANTPYPKTTARLTISVTSAVIVSWRWSQIKRKSGYSTKSGLLIVGDWQPPRQLSLLERMVDPFKRSGRENYMLSLVRRRTEGSILFSLILLTLAWSGFQVRSVVDEWSKDPSLICNPAKTRHRLRVLVAD